MRVALPERRRPDRVHRGIGAAAGGDALAAKLRR